MKSIYSILISIFTLSLAACGGGGGGGDALGNAVQNARAKGVRVTLETVEAKPAGVSCGYVDEETKEEFCFDAPGEPGGRIFKEISLKTVGPRESDITAAIEALRAMDLLVDGSNVFNKEEAHFMIENAIYELQAKLQLVLDKENGSVSQTPKYP